MSRYILNEVETGLNVKVYDVRRTPSDGKSSPGLWPGELKITQNWHRVTSNSNNSLIFGWDSFKTLQGSLLQKNNKCR
jgi:hypothetical protein